jgi:hypothetical protein
MIQLPLAKEDGNPESRIMIGMIKLASGLDGHDGMFVVCSNNCDFCCTGFDLKVFTLAVFLFWR